MKLLKKVSNYPGTLLFDLDGTLLPVGPDFFAVDYPEAVAPYFKHIIEPAAFKEVLFKSTFDMINNRDPQLLNIDAFGISFQRRAGYSWKRVWPVFERFYNEEFPKLQTLVPESKVARSIVEACVSQGWEIVVATNPVFPEVAIRERMKWCGIEDFPWEFITTIDDMHFCKPHIEYYQEIIDRLGLVPSNCVMIGNDMQEDMVAGKLGIKTIFIEDFCIDREDGGQGKDSNILKPDMRGRLKDVPEFTRKMFETGSRLY